MKTIADIKTEIEQQMRKDFAQKKSDPDNAEYHNAHGAALLWVLTLIRQTETDKVRVFRDRFGG
jgi:hypothetical protein